MSADVCPVCGCAKPSSTGVGFYCGGQTTWSECSYAEDLAISRAAEITRLKAKLKQMIEFFDDYTALSGHGQSKVDDEAGRLLASASEILEPKP